MVLAIVTPLDQPRPHSALEEAEEQQIRDRGLVLE